MSGSVTLGLPSLAVGCEYIDAVGARLNDRLDLGRCPWQWTHPSAVDAAGQHSI